VALQFSPDGKRLIAGDYPGGTVVVWDVNTAKQLISIDTGYGPRGLEYFSPSPNWTTLYALRSKQKVEQVELNGKRMDRWECDGEVRAWNMDIGLLQKTYRHDPPRAVIQMQLSADGTKLITRDVSSGVREPGATGVGVSVWDVQTGRYRSLAPGRDQDVLLSPDGQSLAIQASEDPKIEALKLFDLTSGREKWSIRVQGKGEKDASLGAGPFSPDGRLIVVGHEQYVRAKRPEGGESSFKWYDAMNGQEIASFPSQTGYGLFNACFSPDGQTIAAVSEAETGRSQKTLCLFQVPEKKLAKTIKLGGRLERVWPPTFSPDGKCLAVVTQVMPENISWFDARDIAQARIHLIDVAKGEISETLVAPQGIPRSACFSPDGRTLATGGLGRVLLWDLTKRPGALAKDHPSLSQRAR
jgi:WD40 repeat protein